MKWYYQSFKPPTEVGDFSWGEDSLNRQCFTLHIAGRSAYLLTLTLSRLMKAPPGSLIIDAVPSLTNLEKSRQPKYQFISPLLPHTLRIHNLKG